MAKLLVLKGLPASGKSTHAFELVKQGWKRVNKDDLRAMIDGGKWSKENEEIIRYAEYFIARGLLQGGFSVVVDDTNFAWKDIWEIIAKDEGADFEVKYFDTPPDECVMRDAKRGDKSVGAEVIWKMYRKYVEPTIVKPVRDACLPDAFIFDIDGTLARMKNRSPFDWAKVGEDEPIQDVVSMVDNMSRLGYTIIYMSGRDSICRGETYEWLDKYGLPKSYLYMRAEGDSRKDFIVKKELYETHIKDKYNVLGVFDDRNQVVALWRSLGLTCYQVAEGNF